VPPRLVCLVGPTASGKTEIALDIAERVGAEIVSADSRQIYRDLDIGTAKPTAAERARVPHHCLDLVPPDETFDVARYRAAATEAIAGIQARGRPVLVVGGTGLYVRALLHGLCPAPPRSPRLRAVLQAWTAREGAPALHRRLRRMDPAAGERIHAQDAVRITRALEVALLSGRRLSDWQAEHAFAERPYDALVIGLAPDQRVLRARIAARLVHMVHDGWLDEIARLVARGYSDDAPVWRTLGYAEMRPVVEGRRDHEDGIDATILATRRFAKRQRTWFRREPGIVWRDPDVERARIVAEASAFFAGARVAKTEGAE
jgi:tRNA dimethylallyltransferase